MVVYLYSSGSGTLPQLHISYKPQKISPKSQGLVRSLLHDKIRDAYVHPQVIINFSSHSFLCLYLLFIILKIQLCFIQLEYSYKLDCKFNYIPRRFIMILVIFNEVDYTSTSSNSAIKSRIQFLTILCTLH